MSTLSEALAAKSDQLNADDLVPGPRVLKITGGRIAKDGRQTRIILNFEGDGGKPFKPCKTMGRAMVMVWALTDDCFEQQVKGKSIRVYRDPEVTFGDQGQVGGIRISHMSDIAQPVNVKLTVSQGKKSVFTFRPLVTDVPKQSDPNAAENWANDHIGFVSGAADLERLAAVKLQGKKAMDKLATGNPELHERVMAAYTKRLDELSGDDPFAPEGREDADMGDGFPGDDTNQHQED